MKALYSKIIFICLFACVLAIGGGQANSFAAAPMATSVSDEHKQSIDGFLKEIETLHKPLKSSSGMSERLFDPSMNADTKFRTMDDSKEFSGALLCQSDNPVVEVSTSPASNGELNIIIRYDPNGAGNLHSTLIIPSAGGICNGGAVYECQPGWIKCKYGAIEQDSSGVWSINHTYAGGEPRLAEGLKGCFCFSNYCGGTSTQYIQQIESFAGQVIADGIASRNSQLVVSPPVYDPVTKKTTWSAGNVADCVDTNVSSLTAQNNKMELDYKDTVRAAEANEDSPWSLITKNLEKNSSEVYCIQENKVSSEWKEVQKTLTTNVYIGWDSNGGSKQCFFIHDGVCGYYFGEPGSWQGCLDQASQNYAGICNRLWVGGNHFSRITDVRNAHYTSGVISTGNLGVECYGSDGGDQNIALQMDCVGMRFDDYFICYSANKSVVGSNFTNEDVTKFDSCNEIRPTQNGCASLEKSEKCKLNKEITDGVYTIMNGSKTGATVRQACKIITGVKGSITVCEPWWRRTRTYICEDLEGFDSEKERTNYVGDNTNVSDGMLLQSIGDITFDKNGQKTGSVIDGQIQFQSQYDMCTPTCVVQTTIPNYELVIPQEKGKLEADGSWHVPDLEASYVPEKNRTIINTFDCELANNQYTCPVPDGWTLRSQCSCGDGREFVNAITAMLVINQLSKDFICTTGEEIGQCEPEEGTVTYPVVCGNFKGSKTPGSGEDSALKDKGSLVVGTDYWECSPKLWTGKAPATQQHQIYLNEVYSCMANVPTLVGVSYTDPQLDIGQIQPQKSWFTPVVEWGIKQAITHLTGKDSYWVTSSGCECGDLNANEIPICVPTSDNTSVVCLSTGAHHPDITSCKTSCEGRATQGPAHICIWQDSLKTGNIPVNYRLGVYPGETAVFGEVYLNADFQASVETINNFPVCVNETIDEQPEAFYEKYNCQFAQENRTYRTRFGVGWDAGGSSKDCYSFNGSGQCEAHYGETRDWNWCVNTVVNSKTAPLCQAYLNNGSLTRLTSQYSTAVTGRGNFVACWGSENDDWDVWYDAVCTGQKDLYQCNTLGTSYNTQAQCTAGCQKLRYRCKPSGRVVDTPGECYVPKYRCTGTNKSFTTEAACSAACKFTGVTGGSVCNTNKSQESFVVYLREKSGVYGFDMELMKLPPETQQPSPGRIFVAKETYAHTDMIVNQCFRQYTTPYIKFDEPGTNAHFEYASIDQMIYYLAIQQGVLPHAGNGQLPEKPAIYRGSTYRSYETSLNKLYDEEVDDDGNIIQVPNKKLTDEEKQALIGSVPSVTFDENGNYNVPVTDQGRLVPRQPMFLGKSFTSQGVDTSKGGRAGLMSILASGLTSGIYYYECPVGVTNNTTSCGQVSPYGGLADTIQGRKCFQYFCDDGAMMETNAGQSNGCGLSNDGVIRVK